MAMSNAECYKTTELLAKYNGPLNIQFLAEQEDIIRHNAKLVVFVAMVLRSTTSTLIDIDQPGKIADRIKPGTQVRVIKARATMQYYHGWLLAKSCCGIQLASHDIEKEFCAVDV